MSVSSFSVFLSTRVILVANSWRIAFTSVKITSSLALFSSLLLSSFSKIASVNFDIKLSMYVIVALSGAFVTESFFLGCLVWLPFFRFLPFY